MVESKIEWCDRSDWNCIRGCSRVSPGCGGPGLHGGCYAEAIAARFSDPGQPFHGFAERTANGPHWTGKVELIEDRLTLPLKWRKPARIFVSSTSDLFHEKLPDEAIDRVFAVMALAPQHQFMILTKRSARMREYMSLVERHEIIGEKIAFEVRSMGVPAMNSAVALGGDWVPDQIGDEGRVELRGYFDNVCFPWPLPNVMLGVSCEDQPRADARISDLLATPAAVRFCSAEPLLGPIDFTNHDPTGIQAKMKAHGRSSIWRGNAIGRPWLDLVIVGAESGPRARPMELQWVRDIVTQCQSAGVAVFVKQLSGPGGRALKDMTQFPDDLRVREFPRTAP